MLSGDGCLYSCGFDVLVLWRRGEEGSKAIVHLQTWEGGFLGTNGRSPFPLVVGPNHLLVCILGSWSSLGRKDGGHIGNRELGYQWYKSCTRRETRFRPPLNRKGLGSKRSSGRAICRARLASEWLNSDKARGCCGKRRATECRQLGVSRVRMPDGPGGSHGALERSYTRGSQTSQASDVPVGKRGSKETGLPSSLKRLIP